MPRPPCASQSRRRHLLEPAFLPHRRRGWYSISRYAPGSSGFCSAPGRITRRYAPRPSGAAVAKALRRSSRPAADLVLATVDGRSSSASRRTAAAVAATSNPALRRHWEDDAQRNNLAHPELYKRGFASRMLALEYRVARGLCRRWRRRGLRARLEALRKACGWTDEIGE